MRYYSASSERPFFPEREFKSEDEIKLIKQAIKITEIGLARGIEVLKASEIGPKKQLIWGGKPLTSERLRAEIDSAILHAGGAACTHDCGRRRASV